MNKQKLPYLRIRDGENAFFGGNQSWDPKKSVREGACGPVAATGLLCYLEGKEEMERSDFMKRFTRLRRSYFPIVPYLGSNGAGLALGLNIYFLLHGMPYFAFWGISRRKTFPRIERMLSDNLPVILCIGNNLPRFWRRQKLALYQENPDGTMRVHSRTSAHFVTVTEMNEEWMGVSTWGKKLYISREEWEDYVSRYSCAPLSNILVIHRLGKKK